MDGKDHAVRYDQRARARPGLDQADAPTPRAGLIARAIAAELYVSVSTVRSQVQAVYRKLEVSSRAGAVDRARELGLISPR
jgi:hypothetical protein